MEPKRDGAPLGRREEPPPPPPLRSSKRPPPPALRSSKRPPPPPPSKRLPPPPSTRPLPLEKRPPPPPRSSRRSPLPPSGRPPPPKRSPPPPPWTRPSPAPPSKRPPPLLPCSSGRAKRQPSPRLESPRLEKRALAGASSPWGVPPPPAGRLRRCGGTYAIWLRAGGLGLRPPRGPRVWMCELRLFTLQHISRSSLTGLIVSHREMADAIHVSVRSVDQTMHTLNPQSFRL